MRHGVLASLMGARAVQEKSARKALQGSKYVVLETRKDGTKFTTHAMKDAAVRLNDSTKAYSDVQRSLIDSVRPIAVCIAAHAMYAP